MDIGRLQFLAQGSYTSPILDIIYSLFVALSLGYGMTWVYRLTHRGINYDRAYVLTIMLMPLTVTTIIILIKSNLALSLGLVGSLSIIRFRSVIKDPLDMFYLFWSVAIGLGCGTFNGQIITVTSAFISIVMLLCHYFKTGNKNIKGHLMIIECEDSNNLQNIMEEAKSLFDNVQLKRIDSKSHHSNLVIECDFKSDTIDLNLVEELKKHHQISRVQLIHPQVSSIS